MGGVGGGGIKGVHVFVFFSACMFFLVLREHIPFAVYMFVPLRGGLERGRVHPFFNASFVVCSQ